MDSQLKRDLTKLFFLLVSCLGVLALFFVTPVLSTPTLLSIAVAMLLSPLVASLERHGYPRVLSISILFFLVAAVLAGTAVFAFQSGQAEWQAFREAAPRYFHASIAWARQAEESAKARYAFLASLHVTDSLLAWGNRTGEWFVQNGAKIAGQLVTSIFLVPILSFVMLSDGRGIFRRFLHLVPNRFFEPVLIISTQVSSSLANYLRAKLFEALLVGTMTAAGLAMIKAPYAIVLGALAGATNIVPYFGPFIGAVPALLVTAFDPAHTAVVHTSLLLPVLSVYAVVNTIDVVFIFPVIVAKLVNLHPLILIAVVALGQQYYGLVGMLISIPIATALKVVVQEIHAAIYDDQRLSSVG